MRKTVEKIIVVVALYTVNRWVSSGNGHNKNDTHTHTHKQTHNSQDYYHGELFLFLYRIKENSYINVKSRL